MPRVRRTLRPLSSFGAVAALVVAGALVPTGAAAAVTLTVTTVSDAALVAGCSDGVAETTLREALCLATSPGASPATVAVPAGTIQLVAPLSVSPEPGGSVVTVTGAGAGATTIRAAAGARAFDLDPTLLGGLDLTIERLGITGGTGPAADLGGGAILAGTGDPGAPDALTLRDCSVTGNANVPAGAPWAAAAGGAVSMTGGSLTIDRCAFSQNTAEGAPGGAVAFIAVDSSDTVTVTLSTFLRNAVNATTSAGVVGGGALYVQALAGEPTTTITGTTFDRNTVTSTSPAPAFGSAVWAPAGTTRIEESQVVGGTLTGAAGSGGALHLGAGSVTGSRLVGNTTVAGTTTTHDAVRGTGVTVTGNWWGCANPPAETGCQTAPDATTVLPAVVLTGTAAPAAVRAGETSTITASVAMSDGTDVPGKVAAVLAAAPLQWSAGGGSVSGETTLGADLTGRGTFTMGGAPATVTVSVDGASVPVAVGLLVPATVTNPGNQTVAENGSAVFTVTASGSPAPSVTWESAAPGSSTWAPVPGATGATLTVEPVTRALDGTRYRAVASNGVGAAATSGAATLAVTWGPEVDTEPTPVTVVAGKVAEFTVVATGKPAPAYQWQTSTDGSTWTDVAGASSATYRRTTTAADDGLLVRVHVNGAGAVDTTPVALTVQHTGSFAGPASTTVAEGGTATFTATPVGFLPAPAIRWQRWTGSGWVDIPGASGPTYQVVGAPALDGSQYRAVATSTFIDSTTAETVSPAAVLTVSYGPVVDADPVSVAALAGEVVTFTASAHGNPTPTVQWQLSRDGSTWTDVAGASSATYTRTIAGIVDDGLLVRAVFTGAGVATTAPARISVESPPVITTQPLGATIDSGSVATFTVGVVAAPAAALQWQSDAGGTWADLVGETGPALSVIGSQALDGVGYRVVATNTRGTAISAPVVLTVLSAPTVTTPADAATRPGVAVTFATTAAGRPTPTLTWQTSTDGVAWADAGTGPQLTLTPTLADDGLLVRVVATSTIGSGPVQAIGGPARLTVAELPSFVGEPPAITPATAGTAVSMSWVVLSSGGTPRWEVSRDGGRTWTAPPAGFTTSTVSGVALLEGLRAAPAVRTGYLAAYTPTAADDGLMVALTLTNAVGSTARSTTTLEVTAPAPATPAPTTQHGTGSGLSSTGLDATPLLVVALAVLALGALALGLRRRLMRG